MLKENDSLVQVKICGLTSMDDVHIIEKYGADYAGMVLYYPKSRRNIDINLAAVLVAQLKKSDIKSVAVVVSPDVSQLEAIQNAGFDYIQIHGELSDDVYNACSVGIIRAVNIKHQSEEDIYLKLFLAGGLTPDNVKAAIEAVRPDVVDISSGVEYDDVSVKGKDESKVKAFIQNAKY